ncbi:MAG: hypothetical protein HBSAPP04_08280 [Ignavibacteriaceae bacterium]|nr:MAG: hypothetical protein HBSAPP04_08280 [Ignavibacteriaceae bacterium]
MDEEGTFYSTARADLGAAHPQDSDGYPGIGVSKKTQGRVDPGKFEGNIQQDEPEPCENSI